MLNSGHANHLNTSVYRDRVLLSMTRVTSSPSVAVSTKTKRWQLLLLSVLAVVFLFSARATADAIDGILPGHWYEVPNSNLSSVLPDLPPLPPGSPTAIIGAWNGGAYDTNRNRLIVWGGGHADYGGNEIYTFDINTLSWSRVWGPSPDIPPAGACNETYADGNPVSRHTYDGLEYIPGTDRFWIHGGSLYCGNGDAGIDTWEFDFDALSWSRKADVVSGGWMELEAVSAFDAATGHVFLASPTLALHEYDPIDDQWVQRSNTDIGYGMVAAMDPRRRMFVAIGKGRVYYYDLSESGTLSRRTLTTSGDKSILNKNYPGLEYDPIRDVMVAWSGGSDVYLLDLDTAVWTKQPALGGAVPTAAASTGTYGRFRYVPSKDVFIVVNSINQNVYVYRMPTECSADVDCDDGLFCNGSETCVNHVCQAGSDPCPGQQCEEETDQCIAGPQLQLETGTLNVGADPMTVSLVHTYASPVVVSSIQYNNSTTPVVSRIFNVTPTSFDIRLQNPSGDAVAAENVNHLVVEEGVWNVDGVKFEAQKYLSTVTDDNGSWVGETQSYGQSYTNPVVLGQVMSDNDPGWSVFWCRGTSRSNPPSATALATGKTVCEDVSVSRLAETIGFVVFEAGHSTFAGVEFEAALGTDTVSGVGNSPPYSNNFTAPFASAPHVALATMAGMDGVNGGWAYVYGSAPVTTTSIDLAVDEDQIADSERRHTTEQVGYLAIETPLVYPAVPECNMDADCSDGLFCNGDETCVDGACQPASEVCPGLCDEVNDVCLECNEENCSDGLFCNGVETCLGGACQPGTNPCPEQSCDEVSDVCIAEPTAKLEAGAVTVGDDYMTVTLANSYFSPIVVSSVQYNNNTIPVVTRIRNVTATSFDIRLQNPSGGTVVTENVSYMVVEEGVWTIDGVNIEAQSYTSTVTDENGSWVGQAGSYGHGYSNPVVLGQVMSENDGGWSVFWCQGASRTTPPTAAALTTGKTVGEDTNVTRASETVGFIVFEAGHGIIGGVAFEAALGADTVKGVANSPPYAYSFNTAFSSAPQIAVTTMAGVDGGNGAWSQTHGATATSATTLFLSVDEDQVGDSERSHTTEQVGYVVFETPVVYR